MPIPDTVAEDRVAATVAAVVAKHPWIGEDYVALDLFVLARLFLEADESLSAVSP